MDNLWIIVCLVSIWSIKSIHGVYELNTKRSLDLQNYWRPVSSLSLQIPTSHQVLTLSNLDSGNKFRLNQLNSHNSHVLRHIKGLSAPASQYRNPFQYYQSPSKTYLPIPKSSPHLVSSVSSGSYGNVPGNLMKLKPVLGVKPGYSKPIVNSHYYNGVHGSPVNLPSVYKPFPVFKPITAPKTGVDFRDTLLIRDPNLNSHLSAPNSQWIPQKPYLIHSTSQNVPVAVNKPLNSIAAAADAISSYSFFGPAAHIVRHQQTPSTTLLTALPEFTTKGSTSTEFPYTTASVALSSQQNYPPSNVISTTGSVKDFWEEFKHPSNSELTVGRNVVYSTPISNTVNVIHKDENYSHTNKPSQPLTLNEFSKILVPPAPPTKIENHTEIPSNNRQQEFSSYQKHKEIVYPHSNVISSTNAPSTEHRFVKDNNFHPINAEVYPNSNAIFTTEKNNYKNIKFRGSVFDEQNKITFPNYPKTQFVNNSIKPFNHSSKPYSQPISNVEHNFFTIQDAITSPPFLSVPIHTNVLAPEKVTEYPTINVFRNFNEQKDNIVEATTMKPTEQEIVTSAVPPVSRTKIRRRRPGFRMQTTSTARPTQTTKSSMDETLNKEENELLDNGRVAVSTTRANKRQKLNQRKRTRTRTSAAPRTKILTSTAHTLENIPEHNNGHRESPYFSKFPQISDTRINNGFERIRTTDNNLPVFVDPTILAGTTHLQPFTGSFDEVVLTSTPENKRLSSIETQTPISLTTQTYSNLRDYNFDTITTSDKTLKVTKEPLLEMALSTMNEHRFKNIRNRHRLKLRTSTQSYPSSTETASSESNEESVKYSMEITPKTIRLKPINLYESNRPRFSVKDYKSRMNIQGRNGSTTFAPETKSTTTSSNTSRFPTRKRLLPAMRTKSGVTNNTVPVEDVERNPLKNFDNASSSLEPPIQKMESEKPPERSRGPPRGHSRNESRRRSRPTTSSTTTTETSPISRLRKQSTRPRHTTLRERIQNFQNKKFMSNESLEHSEDLVNIVIETKNDSTTEATKPESAIMKIAKQDSHRGSQLSSGVRKNSVEDLQEAPSPSRNSEKVTQLTAGSSKYFNTLNGNSPSRRIGGYFTLATDDPILPIEAFFPNVKKDSSTI